MNYLKENWRELFAVIGIALLLSFIFYHTWKYSNYALYGRISTLESHTDTLAKMVQQEQYQVDVITEYIKTTAHQI